MSSVRAVHPDERRAVLQALGPALDSLALPRVIPKLPTKAERDALLKCAAAAAAAWRCGSLPTRSRCYCGYPGRRATARAWR
jgi:hypothetical protein